MTIHLAAGETQLFCGHCGNPPVRHPRTEADRVCTHCEMGLVREAPSSDAPAADGLFVIVGPELVVEGLSRQAQTVLEVREPDGLGMTLLELLVRNSGDNNAFALLVERAISGRRWPHTVDLVPVGEPQVRFTARLSHCWPPPAALLLLSPATEDTRSSARETRATRAARQLRSPHA
jgi:hypothetical protein